MNMISLLIGNTISTLIKITELFSDLLASLGIVSAYGGIAGFLVSVVIIGLVIFFLLKLFFSSGKMLLLLVPLAILFYIFLLSTVV